MLRDQLVLEFESLIDQWLLNPDPEIEALVRQHRVLPISADMGGNYFFRPHDAQVVCCGWGPNDDLYLQEPMMRMGALIAGVKKYPQLKAFLPQRPSDAADCLACRGTGRFRNIAGCGACWCLGWLHESVQVAEPASVATPSITSQQKRGQLQSLRGRLVSLLKKFN